MKDFLKWNWEFLWHAVCPLVGICTLLHYALIGQATEFPWLAAHLSLFLAVLQWISRSLSVFLFGSWLYLLREWWCEYRSAKA